MQKQKSCGACGAPNFTDAVSYGTCGAKITSTSTRPIKPPHEGPPSSPIAPTAYTSPTPQQRRPDPGRTAQVVKFLLASFGFFVATSLVSTVAYLFLLDVQPPDAVGLPLEFLLWCFMPGFVGTALAGYTIGVDGTAVTAVTGGIAIGSIILIVLLVGGSAGILLNDAYAFGEFVSSVASGVIGGGLGGYARQRKLRRKCSSR
jgi:hypothetical protein